MAHPRAMIRQAIVDLLALPGGDPETYPTSCGANVFKSRMRAWWPEELPAIAVYARSDNAELFNQAPLEYRRTVEVVIEIVAKLDDDLDDELDAIAAEVERILILNETLKPEDWPFDEWPEIRLGDTSITINAHDGENQHGAAVMTFPVTYYQPAPEDITGTADGLAADIQDLDTVTVGWNLENEQEEDDRAQDTYDFQEPYPQV